jgi:hypothetical protein
MVVYWFFVLPESTFARETSELHSPSQVSPTRAIIKPMDSNTAADNVTQKISTLLCELRDIALHVNTRPEERSLLTASCRALEIQETIFRPASESFSKDWRPTQLEGHIINAACGDLYPTDEIESVFHRYGGIYGIVALVAVFRKPNSFKSARDAIKGTPGEKWLAWNASQLFRLKDNDWVREFSVRASISPLPHLTRNTRRYSEPQPNPQAQYRYPKREGLPCPNLVLQQPAERDGDARQVALPESLSLDPLEQHLNPTLQSGYFKFSVIPDKTPLPFYFRPAPNSQLVLPPITADHLATGGDLHVKHPNNPDTRQLGYHVQNSVQLHPPETNSHPQYPSQKNRHSSITSHGNGINTTAYTLPGSPASHVPATSPPTPPNNAETSLLSISFLTN